MDQRSSSLDQRSSSLDQRSSSLDQRSSSLDQRSSMDPARLKRKGEIIKALQFIQCAILSPLLLKLDFLTGLVCNLLEEGNTLFKDGAWEEALKEFSEGLSVSQYAASEDIHIPEVLLESLYVNRAAAYYSMVRQSFTLKDCDKALEVCKESRRALFRKALCLKELGKYKEAYSCTTDCLLINRMVKKTYLFIIQTPSPFNRCKLFKDVVTGIYTFAHKPDLVHSCEKNILLCREKDGVLPWTRVRPMPAWTSFTGPFVLCRDLGLCKYGEDCTFAFNQMEIDVWTEERKGRFDRKLLCEKPAVKQEPVNGVIQILQENKGVFIFLCGACFDCKPTIISKCSKDDNTICSNTSARHLFDTNKCLAFMMRNITVRYRKIRVLQLHCQLDLCRHCIRYGCLLGDKCMFAHSDVELKTWKLQRETGITPDEIVKSLGPGNPKGGRPKERLNMRMRFVCGHCWRDGVSSDPDKSLKYCSAKARHMWTKDKRILLVKSSERSKWVMVRTLPHCKHFPLHYDICHRILDRGRCNVGNCTFAHSQEEKDMWTYMKNNKLVDMQQVYDMWLQLSTLNHQNEEPVVTQPEEKSIVMPTDYAEPMDGFHCRLCGRHSNSERQWQQHISSEKHKDRVFSCDEEEKSYTCPHRRVFSRLEDDCPDGVSCDYAHSLEELQEWIERRDFLRRKLDRAREDMLIMADESDFGKYNFLLQD
uniref:C3H1-type domain-containing protein n=1 Tax=Periophthalmus magnuspinnatus TaxID=409849 RepID=A0A3B4B0H9_9GOBI